MIPDITNVASTELARETLRFWRTARDARFLEIIDSVNSDVVTNKLQILRRQGPSNELRSRAGELMTERRSRGFMQGDALCGF